jgi:hypothetical protein
VSVETHHPEMVQVLMLSKDILDFRKSMWIHVSSRRHEVLKVFPFGRKADEVMLYGTVEYSMKNGKSLTIDWAARAHLVKKGSHVKMDFYQVYLVRSCR